MRAALRCSRETRYWQAWVYVTIFLGASVLTTIYLMRNDPALLARRMRGGPMFERERAQGIIMVFTSLGFIALLVVPGLDHRFGWSTVPVWAVVLGDVLVAIGFFLIFRVYRENTFTAATVEVTAGQRVVETGPYAVVRHPMYARLLTRDLPGYAEYRRRVPYRLVPLIW